MSTEHRSVEQLLNSNTSLHLAGLAFPAISPTIYDGRILHVEAQDTPCLKIDVMDV